MFKISVKTLNCYQSHEDDELSFPKNAIIKNVKKVDSVWWRGDYGGRMQYLFIANLAQEIDYEEAKRYEAENVRTNLIINVTIIYFCSFSRQTE